MFPVGLPSQTPQSHPWGDVKAVWMWHLRARVSGGLGWPGGARWPCRAFPSLSIPWVCVERPCSLPVSQGVPTPWWVQENTQALPKGDAEAAASPRQGWEGTPDISDISSFPGTRFSEASQFLLLPDRAQPSTAFPTHSVRKLQPRAQQFPPLMVSNHHCFQISTVLPGWQLSCPPVI